MSTPSPNTTAALAKHLGISRWTVSRVLNGHPGVKEETVRRVKQAVDELGFRPSALARGLRGGQTTTVGVCFQDLDSPVMAMRAASLQQRLREEGYDTLGIDPQNRFGALRIPGLRRYAPEFGLDFERDFHSVYHPGETRHTFDYGYELAGEWIEKSAARPSTAIIALNDRIAIGAINRLREDGFRVPEQVSVVGYDNIAVGEHFFPTITTVDHQTDRMMDLAVRGLLERLDPGKIPFPPRQWSVQPKLIIRKSSGRCRK